MDESLLALAAVVALSLEFALEVAAGAALVVALSLEFAPEVADGAALVVAVCVDAEGVEAVEAVVDVDPFPGLGAVAVVVPLCEALWSCTCSTKTSATWYVVSAELVVAVCVDAEGAEAVETVVDVDPFPGSEAVAAVVPLCEALWSCACSTKTSATSYVVPAALSLVSASSACWEESCRRARVKPLASGWF